MTDRDIGVMAGGGLIAVICLLLPFGFGVKIAIAGILLVFSMWVALAHFGKDKKRLEEYLWRRRSFVSKPSFFNLFPGSQKAPTNSVRGGDPARNPAEPPLESAASAPAALPATNPATAPAFSFHTSAPDIAPEMLQDIELPETKYKLVTIDWDEVEPAKIIPIILFVVGAYVIYWLYFGGALQISDFFTRLR